MFERIGENFLMSRKDKSKKFKFFFLKRTRILMFGKRNKNYNVSKDTANNSKAYRERGKIPMFARKT